MSKGPNMQQYPFKSKPLYGHSTTQGVESMNKTNMDVRECDNDSGFLRAIQLDQKRHVEAATLAENLKDGDVPPRVRTSMNVNESKALQVPSYLTIFEGPDQNVAQVASEANKLHRYTVNFTDKTCSCGKWQSTTFPYVHVARLVIVNQQTNW